MNPFPPHVSVILKVCKSVAGDQVACILRVLVPALMLFAFAGQLSPAQVKRFTLLNTTDEHSTLLPLPMTDYHREREGPAIGGYARLSTLVRQVREAKGDEPVLLLSTGDILGGTPFAWLALEGFSAEIELMKKIGYDGMTIGNHEFDYGPELLADYLVRAGYPDYNEKLAIIASNLIIPDGHKLLEPAIREYRLYELSNGIKVGVFGLLGKEAYSVTGFAEPVTVDDQHTVAGRQVRQLRDAGADIVLALSHSGINEDRELAAAVEGIDVILGGHDHYMTEVPEIVNNTIIFHSGYYLKYLGVIELEWNSKTGELSTVNETGDYPYLIPLDGTIEEDPEILSMTDGFLFSLNEFVSAHTEGEFDDVAAPVLHSEFALVTPGPFTETTVGNFVTDAMRIMVEQVTGERVDFAFQGNGVIRADIIPGTMEWSAGDVSFFDLVTVSGLGSGPDGRAGYPLVSLYLTEREVLNVLEISSLLALIMDDIYFLQVSGLRYSYDPGKAIWLRIPFIGTPVPAYRSVLKAELFTGKGIQGDKEYILLDGKGERLYHIVTDYYLTSFLPMVGDILPRLRLVLKDRNGNPVEPEQTIISHHGKEYKVWEAVAQYATSFAGNGGNLSVMPEYYLDTGDRIVAEKSIPLRVWSYILLGVILILIIYLLRLLVIKISKHKKRQSGIYSS